MSRYTSPSRPLLGQMPGDGAETDGAVAAQHQRELARGERRADALGGLARARRRRRARFCAYGLLAIGPPAPDLGVAVIDDRDAGRREPGEQAGVAQRARRLLLAGRIRAGARRHADHTERSRHAPRRYPRWRRDEPQPRRQRRLEHALALHARRAAHTRVGGDPRQAAADEAAPAERAVRTCAARAGASASAIALGQRLGVGVPGRTSGSRGSSGTRRRCGRARPRRRRRSAPSRRWRAAAGCGRSRGRCA